jgi:hypothetical protein
VLAAYGVGSARGALLVASVRLPRRYLTVMLLCWGLARCRSAAFGLSTLLWVMVAASLRCRHHGRRPRWSSGARCCSAGARAPARAGVEPRLLRVAGADAGVDGAGRPGRRDGVGIPHDVRGRPRWCPPVLAVGALRRLAAARATRIAHPLDRAAGPTARAP